MHPEINTHNKIRANIFGFAVIPPQFFGNVRHSEKAFGQVKRRRRTRAASCGASKAPPHEGGTRLS